MIDSALARQLLGPGAAAGRFYGVTVGLVTNNQDPEGCGRVKVSLPWLSEDNESHWARVVTPMAGAGRGLYLLPEVDDEVLVGFEHGRVDSPFVLGALWNGQDAPPESNDDGDNNRRSLVSRSGHTIRLDDTDGGEKIEIVDAAGKQSIVFDSAAGTLTLSADQDLVIESKSGALKLTGKNGVEIVSQAALKLEASQNAELTSSAQVNVKGAAINLN